MFEEVGEQYNQFVASSRTSLPFPIHGFDPFTSHHHSLPIQLQTTQVDFPHMDQRDHEIQHHHDKLSKNTNSFALSFTSGQEREGSVVEDLDPWSSNEVLALHKIRCGMQNWLPGFTWEEVSRKLEDLGFKRSAEKCKEKFEEERRHMNNMSFGKDYRLFSQLEVLCQSDQTAHFLAEKNLNVGNLHNDEQLLNKVTEINGEPEDSRNEFIRDIKSNSLPQGHEKKTVKDKMKRKRNQEFETLKDFCEDIIRKMMHQQEEIYDKILEEMMKRDEDKTSKDEAWKKQELERITKETEIRAQEQAIAIERQTILTEFLQKITSNISEIANFRSAIDEVFAVSMASIPSNPLNFKPSQNSMLLSSTEGNQKILISSLENTSSDLAMVEQKLSSPSSSKMSAQKLELSWNKGEDFSKRWPREEVLALISLRGSINGNNNNEEKEGTNPRGPLWERISQRMLEMGYKRSSKRCKEKWENINKYFRKTKDANKKRSTDSRTCPYFEQLTNLYSQGGSLAGPVNALVGNVENDLV